MFGHPLRSTLSLSLLLLLSACGKESEEVAVPENLPVDLNVELEFSSLDGSETFGVPKPGDAEWEDYLEMLAHPQFKSRLQGQPGYAKAYDPEWRAVVSGVRDVPPSDLVLSHTYESAEKLIAEVLAALQRRDDVALAQSYVNEHEFSELCWPAFPQSRPYARIPVGEAWGFHFGHSHGGLHEAMRELGGRDLSLESIEWGEMKDYKRFKLYGDVHLNLVDMESEERVRTGFLSSIIEREGRFKVYIYKE